MDALKAEIASKRKALQDEPLVADRPNKYMRRGDIERLREEKERKEKEEKQKQEDAERLAKDAERNAQKVERQQVSLMCLLSGAFILTSQGRTAISFPCAVSQY
jgi:pre-mRNA-splicing factor 18